jgi:quinohemoprotein ethanol dehydrogenase
MAPDLRASSIPFSAKAFEEVVRNGALVNMGMPQYPHLTDQDLMALQHFIRKTARNDLADGAAVSGTIGGH